ncbi:GNAT family N-acetyltransferase [uncultured Methylobacterium sp.]|uniref:GNAT family N-acetyltransferase n=1 Tax=uncultured Methylobacterium sp. TaxID=157278 RepID=UPI0035CC134D
MASLGFERMLDAHLRMQAGCYVSGVDEGEDGARYLWSDGIAEPGFNLAVGSHDIAWVRVMAARRERLPAILARDPGEADRHAGRPDLAGVFHTRWMARSCAATEAAPASLDIGTDPAPGSAFLSVCGDLFADPAINAVAQAVFVPTLRGARAVEGVAARHLTLSEADEPVACASVYVAGDLAGLYNVGTRASRQGRGWGTAVTRAAIAAAAEAGARTIVLQCVAGGTVERLYAGMGFAVVAEPVILVFSPAPS